MWLKGNLVVSDIYYSEKSDNTYITGVPLDTGGIFRFVISGKVLNIKLGQELAIDGNIKFDQTKGGAMVARVEPEAIKLNSNRKEA